MTIDIKQPSRLHALNLTTRYQVLFKQIIDYLKLPHHVHVDVWITSNATIKRYNARFRNKDVATDVLSFPLYDPSYSVPPSMPLAIGQLIISEQKAFSQAKAYGHDPLREFSFLFVHGVLHCLGYNHETVEDEAKMFALQKTILGKRVTS